MHIKALFLATACLFVRTVFRSVELSEGFTGKLANNEVQFMVLDGVMVLIASICMTVMHPGYAFGKRWNDASFSFRDPRPARGSGDDSAVDEARWLDRIPIMKNFFPNVLAHDGTRAHGSRGQKTEDRGNRMTAVGEKTESKGAVATIAI